MTSSAALGGTLPPAADGDYGSVQSSPGGEIAQQQHGEKGQGSASYNIADALIDENAENLCPFFTDVQLGKIAAECMADYRLDEQNFASRKQLIEEVYKLALQVKEPKNYPFENASNIKYPLLTKAAFAFASLAYPAVVIDDSVVRGKVIGNDEGGDAVMGPDQKPLMDEKTGKPMKKNAGLKAKRAERVSTFMSWQVLEDMPGWEDDTDRLLHIIPIIGCAFKKTFRNAQEMRNESKLVLPQFLIINLNARSMDTAFRATELYDLYPNEIEANIRMGIFREFQYKKSVATAATMQEKYPGAAHGEGEAPASSQSQDADKPSLMLEMHRWLDLDEDGYQEPYIVTIHAESEEIARIQPRFDVDGIIAQDIKEDAAGVKTFIGIKRIKAQTQYQKFGFIPDPEGSIYDIGFGYLLRHLNDAANTTINQMIDAGHRKIMGGGFLASGLRMKRGNLRFAPGEYKTVDTNGQVLKDSIVPLQMPEPDTVLFQLMMFLIKAAEEIAIITQALDTNAPDNMAASVGLAKIAQGLQKFKAVFRRVHRGLKGEFQRLYELNAKYLTQAEYAAVLDDPDADKEKDFDTKAFGIVPVSDPDTVNNIENIMRAAALLAFKDDPMVDGVEVRKRYFKALNLKDVEELVRIPPKITDDLVEAQKATLQAEMQQAQAETEKMNHDNEREDIRLALEIEKTLATIQQTVSAAVLNLAKAEQADKQVQIDQFLANINALEKRMSSYVDIRTQLHTEQQSRRQHLVDLASASAGGNGPGAGNVAPAPDVAGGS